MYALSYGKMQISTYGRGKKTGGGQNDWFPAQLLFKQTFYKTYGVIEHYKVGKIDYKIELGNVCCSLTFNGQRKSFGSDNNHVNGIILFWFSELRASTVIEKDFFLFFQTEKRTVWLSNMLQRLIGMKCSLMVLT